MFTIIGIMFGGILVGYLMRNIKLLKYVGKSISWTICALLLFLGIAVGLNDNIINNLQSLGLQGFIFAILATFGSVSAAWLVDRIFFKNKG
ncbi:MAG: lysine exporter LysO family protein [Muribaculaceae bacterium]|nr:lysine exporter LysO family protein [Muribaculaceae bacterium]